MMSITAATPPVIFAVAKACSLAFVSVLREGRDRREGEKQKGGEGWKRQEMEWERTREENISSL